MNLIELLGKVEHALDMAQTGLCLRPRLESQSTSIVAPALWARSSS